MADKFKTGKIEKVEFLEKDEISAFGNYMYSTFLSLDTLIKNMQSAKAFYQNLTDSIDDMILILDTDGKIYFANRKALELGFGYENLIGRCFLVLIVGSENRKRIRQKLKLREKTVEKVEIRKRSGKIYALMSLVPFEDSLIVSIKDITPIKQMEDRIRKLEAFYVLGELTAGLAHELKNALLPIKLLSDVENWDEKDIKVVKHAIDRINNTITSVLSLAGTTTVESRTLNAKDFVEDTVKAFEPLIKEKRVNLHIQAEDFTFVSDMNALRVILNNLLKNALDAVKYGETVRVKLEKADNKVILSVEDDGPGISTKYMDKVFDPFFTTKENGTGLGFSLVLKYTYKLGVLCMSNRKMVRVQSLRWRCP